MGALDVPGRREVVLRGEMRGETDMTELEELKERVRILEQRSRRLRNIGTGLALFVIAGFAFAQQRQGTAPRTLEAERLVIRYPNGKEAIVLAAEKDNLGEWARASYTLEPVKLALQCCRRRKKW